MARIRRGCCRAKHAVAAHSIKLVAALGVDCSHDAEAAGLAVRLQQCLDRAFIIQATARERRANTHTERIQRAARIRKLEIDCSAVHSELIGHEAIRQLAGQRGRRALARAGHNVRAKPSQHWK